MKNSTYITLTISLILISTLELMSYSPKGKDFGFGIMLGEPTGLTAKLWTSRDNAFAFNVGNFRIGADYLWHFNAFNSKIVNMYSGPGIAIGIGESGGWWYHNKNKVWFREDNDDIGFGVRGVFGINIVPRNTPLEIFGELGVMIGLLPGTFTNVEGAIGIRYYF